MDPLIPILVALLIIVLLCINDPDMLGAIWRCFTGLFGCFCPPDDYELEDEDTSKYIDRLTGALPKKAQKCLDRAEEMKLFSGKIKDVTEKKTVKEMISSYCAVLAEICGSSNVIAMSLALNNSSILSDKCKMLHLLDGTRKSPAKLASSISQLEARIAKLTGSHPPRFDFCSHSAIRVINSDKVKAMSDVIDMLRRELLSCSHVVRFIASRRGRVRHLSLDLHCCTVAHAWHLASTAMDKMSAGDELTVITGNGADSVHSTGPKRIREDFLERFEQYTRAKGMAYVNRGHPKKHSHSRELNEGAVLVQRIR